MDKKHLEGAAKKFEGKVKVAAGKVVGNDRLQAEGQSDKLDGRLREAAGDLKDAAAKVKKAVKR